MCACVGCQQYFLQHTGPTRPGAYVADTMIQFLMSHPALFTTSHIVSAHAGTQDMDVVANHIAPSLTIDSAHDDVYSAYNKPGAVLHWLEVSWAALQMMHQEILWYFSMHFASSLVVLANLTV